MPNQRLPSFVPPVPVVPIPGGDPDVDAFQKSNTGREPVDVSRAPQSTFIGANDAPFQPSPGLDSARGDLSHAPVLHDNWQVVAVMGSGDLAAGGSTFGGNRTPTIVGISDNLDAQLADRKQS